ncbi:MAG: ATP-binding protein [Eubacterium sp.]|nr:ATP-binding protein [Eubacterium sp.]
MIALRIDATIANLDTVIDYMYEKLMEKGCSKKIILQLRVAVEELYVNIAHYAYGDKTGYADFEVEFEGDNAIITLIDEGVPFDPLAKLDPDTTLSVEDRPIGGLGIFMAKKSVDDFTYKNENGKNITQLTKKIAE